MLEKLSTSRAMLLFQIMRQGGLLLIAICLTQVGLTPEAIGEYEQLVFVGYAVSFFWISGLTQGLLSYYPRLAGTDQAGFLRAVAVAFFLFTATVVIVLDQFPWAIQLLTGKSTLPLWALFRWFLLFNLPSYLVEYVLLLRQRARVIVGYGLLAYGAQVLVMLIPLLLGWPFVYCFWGLATLAVFKFCWLAVMLWRRGGPMRLPLGMIRTWLTISWPLVLYALLGGLMPTFDQWLVNFWFAGDSAQFAFFRYGARELPLVLAFTEAFNAALVPRIAASFGTGLPAVKRQTRMMMHGLFPLSIVLVLTSFWWFPRVFSSAFTASIPVFNIFLLLIISRVVFSRTLLVGLQENKIVLYISLIELSVNILLSLVFIRYWGISGVAWATVIAFSLEKALQVGWLHYRHQVRWSTYLDIPWWLGYSSILLVAFFLVSQ